MGGPGRELLSELEGCPPRSTVGVSDRIEIRDLRVTGVHGVLPEERDRAQPFSVDVVAWVDMEAAQLSDELADTVDYGALARTAADVVGGPLLPAARGAGRAPGRAPCSSSTPGSRRWRSPCASCARRSRSTWLHRGAGAPEPLMVPVDRLPLIAAPGRRAFIGLGSNLGDRRAFLRQAVAGLRPRW